MTGENFILLDDGPDSASAVAEYLRQRPDFLVKQPQLLEEITVPHDAGSAVSLVERQVATLRRRNKQMQIKLREWMDAAEHNDSLSLKLHRLTLKLIEARDLDTVFAVLYRTLARDFRADHAALWLFVDGIEGQNQRREFIGTRAPKRAVLEGMLEGAKPLCGALTEDERNALFEKAAQEIGSAAVLPMRKGDWSGILAIGVRDPARFQAEMGTDFLIRLGEIVSAVLYGRIGDTGEQSGTER